MTSRAYDLLLATCLTALFAALYADAMTVPLYFDDVIWITRGLRADLPLDLFRPGHFNFVRPTTVLWYHLWAPICGATPVAWRLTAAALFLTTAAALHALGRGLGQSRLGSAVTVLFFVTAAHHWELVYGVSTVGDLLVGLFTTLTVTTWIRWRRDDSPSAWTVSMIALALALGSKESAMVAPLLLVLYEGLRCRDVRGLRSAARRLATPLALAVALLGLDAALVLAAGKGVPPVHPSADLLSTWGLQIGASLLTVPLRNALGLTGAAIGGSVLATWTALLVAAVVCHHGRLRDTVGFTMGWMALAWLPYLLLVPEKLDQDRYGYLASIGTAMLAGLLADALVARTQRSGPRARPTLRAAGLAAVVAVMIWNAHCQTQSAADLRRWLARRGDVADRVREIAPSCPPGVPVYIFSDPGTWHEAGYAFALFTGRPLGEVRDGWDLILDRPTHHRALLWSQEVACYVDLHEVNVLPVEETNPAGVGWNTLSGWTREGLAGTVGGTRCTDGSAMLSSPLLDLSIWSVDRVVVDYRAWNASAPPSSRAAPRMWLVWSTRREGGFVESDAVGAPLVADGQPHEAVFVPWLSPRWWRGERLRRLGITPVEGTTRVEIRSVRVMPPLPPAARRHIE